MTRLIEDYRIKAYYGTHKISIRKDNMLICVDAGLEGCPREHRADIPEDVARMLANALNSIIGEGNIESMDVLTNKAVIRRSEGRLEQL